MLSQVNPRILPLENNIADEDTTRTSTPATPQAPPITPPPRAPTVDHPVGPITRARAGELNFIMLLRNEGPAE
jgi:hypothetical protein